MLADLLRSLLQRCAPSIIKQYIDRDPNHLERRTTPAINQMRPTRTEARGLRIRSAGLVQVVGRDGGVETLEHQRILWNRRPVDQLVADVG